MVVVTLVVVASPLIIYFLESLVLGQLGLLCGVFTPVAVPTGGVTPLLVRHPEAAVLVASLLSLDGMF
jgi:hypothetical protein